MFIIQLPCCISSPEQNIFYNNNLNILLSKMCIIYDIYFLCDIKRNNKCSNLHLIMMKKSKKYKPPINKNVIILKHEYKLSNILNSLSIKYNINIYSKKFNISNIWRSLYSESYYINSFYKNKQITFNSFTRSNNLKQSNYIKTKIILDIDNSLISNKTKLKKAPTKNPCKVRYDRFNNIIREVVLL